MVLVSENERRCEHDSIREGVDLLPWHACCHLIATLKSRRKKAVLLLLPPTTATATPAFRANRLLQLLLWAELVGVSALLLAAVGGTRRKASLQIHH